MQNLRNIAIIAHVDHGKTTLVDALLRQSMTHLAKNLVGTDLIMDSNELERERGITIFSKNASIVWHDYKINIIDTPGHADFGGEVERVLSMADGCLLLVDAKEGPMPQTRFVLKKALAMKMRIIVVINKIDKSGANPAEALNKTFDLFMELGADDKTADFPVVYASAKQGKAGYEPDLDKMTNIDPIYETIIKEVPAPLGDVNQPLQMLITSVTYDNFKGHIAIGKIYNGKIIANQEIRLMDRDGLNKKFKLTSLMKFQGLDKIEADEALAGEIVALAGISDAMIGETVADPVNSLAMPLLKVEEPTVKINLMINDSPFAGKEGKFVTSRQIKERLTKELETDMALRVEDSSQSGRWIVSGRGELHLAILIERLRREGYEFQVSRPQVIPKEVDGKMLVPWEEAIVEVPDAYSGAVIQKLGSRNGQLLDMRLENNITFLEFLVPTRGLFGYRGEFLTDTKGLGIIHTNFADYKEDATNWRERDRGSLVVHETGSTNMYGLLNIQERGTLFLGPGIAVYKGQVVGQNARPDDMRVNVCKAKELSNMRSKGNGVDKHFDAPKIMDLEHALDYISDDELVEVTPLNIRIRKVILDEAVARKKSKGIKD